MVPHALVLALVSAGSLRAASGQGRKRRWFVSEPMDGRMASSRSPMVVLVRAASGGPCLGMDREDLTFNAPFEGSVTARIAAGHPLTTTWPAPSGSARASRC